MSPGSGGCSLERRPGYLLARKGGTMKQLLKGVAAERAVGGRPSVVRAVAAASLVGAAAAGVTYRVLRS
jgi:hypothetical protein